MPDDMRWYVPAKSNDDVVTARTLGQRFTTYHYLNSADTIAW